MLVPGRSPARLVISLVTLAVFGFIVLNGNARLGASAVYFIPGIAIALVIGVVIVRLALSAGGVTRVVPAAPARRRSAIPAVAGLALGFAGWYYAFGGADANARAFAADASCSAGFTLQSSVQGACRLESGTILRTWASYHRGGTTHWLSVAAADGHTYSVALGKGETGNVYAGAKNNGDTSATLQLFRTDVARVATASGVSQTTAYPPARAANFALMGIVFGGIGSLLALFAALRPR